MPIPIQHHTRQALGDGLLPRCDSRALFAARFADPASAEKERESWFGALIGKPASVLYPSTSWLPADSVSVLARLMSRMMVNLAGGVMENANLCLDRYGLPVIPGSAVKGCARRMALQALHDWLAAGTERPVPNDACAPCCEGFQKPSDMLAVITRIFGWTPEDWSVDKRDGLFKSDFAWAAHGNEQILLAARSLLPTHETSAGTIAYLQASPNRDPGLELDVVTPHHTAYYEGDNSGAPDTEDPVPVYFPAVRPQPDDQYFTFSLVPLARAHDGDLEAAKTFLSFGLELIGLGAKTNAGYGVFEVPELADINRYFEEQMEIRRQEEAVARVQKETEERAAANAHLLAIQPDPALLARFESLKSDQLRAAINKFQYDEQLWPASPSEEATALYHVSLLAFLTETQRSLYEEEKSKPKSKVHLALQKLAAKYARELPE